MITNFPYQKALVTGGAGFIGSHLAEELVHAGIDTISIDNYISGKKENLLHLKQFKNFQEAKCDVLDYEELEPYIEWADVIFHQAASKKTVCLRDPRQDLDINAKGAFNLLELSVKHKVKKYVHASTGSVYGEAQYYPQDESHPLCPTSYYGVSKLAGEKYTSIFHQMHNLNTTVLRYFHVYGSRQEYSDVGGVVSIFLNKLLNNQPLTVFGDGTQERSFTYVKDVIKANILAATNNEANGKVYNCASGIVVTINELIEHLTKITEINPVDVKYDNWLPGDIKIFNVSNEKICKDLKMGFVQDVEVGLKETVNWAINYFRDKKENNE